MAAPKIHIEIIGLLFIMTYSLAPKCGHDLTKSNHQFRDVEC
jgi:hypothetical protein